jgi:4-amino-4-deoxy-L-arabinose transferase-like glycosyltransferase
VDERWRGAACGAAALGAAVVLFTRFGLDGVLYRDQAIYAYAGQQLAHGVAPYVSIFDAKAPLGSMLAGVAALVARALGTDSLSAIRLAYFVVSLLAVLATYLLGARLWHSRLAGLTAAVVLACFRGFAGDALGGPDPKTAGVLLVVLCLWLVLRRQWLLAAAAGSLAALVWQPFVLYPLVVVLAAAVGPARGRRWRTGATALAGALLPALLTLVYFGSAGALGPLLESTVGYPLTGVVHARETVGGRLARVVEVGGTWYGFAGLLWVGLALLVVATAALLVRHRREGLRVVRRPLVFLVAPTLLLQAGYLAVDFQGPPDLYPLLPYAALGFGGAVAALLRLLTDRRAGLLVRVAVPVALTALVASAAVSFEHDDLQVPGALVGQRTDACALDRLVVPGRPLYALGDPTTLVLTGRANPERHVFLSAGVDAWHVRHTAGGFEGWTEQVRAADPSVVVVAGWTGPFTARMRQWLGTQGYRRVFVGRWRTFVDPAVLARARRLGIALTSRPVPVVTDLEGHPLTPDPCPGGHP